MELVLVKVNGSEWEYMWNWLAQHPLNEGITEPSVALHEGQAWQYTGSYKQNERVIHSFRHRLHPRTLRREEVNVQASEGMNLTEIQKKFKL